MAKDNKNTQANQNQNTPANAPQGTPAGQMPPSTEWTPTTSGASAAEVTFTIGARGKAANPRVASIVSDVLSMPAKVGKAGYFFAYDTLKKEHAQAIRVKLYEKLNLTDGILTGIEKDKVPVKVVGGATNNKGVKGIVVYKLLDNAEIEKLVNETRDANTARAAKIAADKAAEQPAS